MGCHPFDLDDANRVVYHAAAAAAANFPVAALVMAQRLFETAGVPFDAARPLVEAVIANSFDLTPRESLTGPIARGDVETVRAQQAAVRAAAQDFSPAFDAMVDATSAVAGTASKEKQR